MSNLIFAVLVTYLALAVTSGDAIRCWECNSERDYNCGDPFHYSHFPLIDCDMKQQGQSYRGARSVCLKRVQNVHGIPVVDRSCAWEESYGGDPCGYPSANYATIEHCSVCRYDSCNGAGSTGPAFWTLAISAAIYATTKCL